MSANQTIDGVPRETVSALEKARDVLRAIIRDKVAGVHYASAQAACHQINHVLELRALLDAPACSACNDTGRLREPGCQPGACTVCLENSVETVAGHHPACRAVDDYKPGECSHSCKPASQPQGEPVAHMPVERCYDVRAKMIIAFNEAKKAGGDLDDALDAAYKSALRYSPNPSSAEQPAPVAAAPINYGALDPVERLAVCRGDVVPVSVASRDESIAWLKRINGIGQNRAELIYSMGFRRHTEVPQS